MPVKNKKRTLEAEAENCKRSIEKGEQKDALAAIDRIRSIITPDDKEWVTKVFIFEGILYRNHGKLTKAIQCFDQAESQNLPAYTSEIYRQKAYALIELGKSGEADKFAQAAHELANADQHQEANAMACIGHLLENTGNYSEAITWYREALKKCERFPRREATLHGDIGKVYGIIGQYDDSIEELNRALAVAQGCGHVKCIISSYFRLADVYREIRNEKRTLDLLKQAHALAKHHGFKREIADTLLRYGIYFQKQNCIEKAKKKYEDALKIYEDLGYLRQAIHCGTFLGQIYENESLLTARTHYQTLLNRLGDKVLEQTELYKQLVANLGETYKKLNYPEGQMLIDLAEKLNKISKESGVFTSIMEEKHKTEILDEIKKYLNKIQRKEDNIYYYRELYINFNAGEAKLKGKLIHFTTSQLTILRYMWDNRGQVCSTTELLVAIGNKGEIITRTIDVQISKIRKIIGEGYLETRRGEGFSLKYE